MGFDVLSESPDTSAPAPPVPETIMPPPQPHPDDFGSRVGRRSTARNGWLDRRANVPMYFTDTAGTRVHTRTDCHGLRDRQSGGNRVKPLQTKETCSWCCGGVMVVP